MAVFTATPPTTSTTTTTRTTVVASFANSTSKGFALRCYFSASPSSSSSSFSACYHHSMSFRVLEESSVNAKRGWNVRWIKFVTKKTRRKTTTNDDSNTTNNNNNNNQEKEQHQCHYCERTASSRWYKNKTQCNACYNRTRRIRIKNDLQTHSCEICQTSSSVEWYRNKFTGAKTGRLCHSCYCRERATALDVRCAECRSEKTSGNWAIPKTKGKYKPGDRLCNVCYRRELVSLKAEAEEESTSEV